MATVEPDEPASRIDQKVLSLRGEGGSWCAAGFCYKSWVSAGTAQDIVPTWCRHTITESPVDGCDTKCQFTRNLITG
jgi:hypothetical protein